MPTSNRKHLVIIGVGGASCSGKTLLAKHIRAILPSSATILHQDDFAPPIERVPFSANYPDLQDWDDPPTCILWPEFKDTLNHVRKLGAVPPQHTSHDHLNKQIEVEVDPKVADRWKRAFVDLEKAVREGGVEISYFIVDGFVLYWDSIITNLIDIKLFLRVPHDILKKRREERQIYVLQNPDDAAAGGVWVDPPNYFEQIVYPAYVKAHKDMFVGEDVEDGAVRPGWSDLHILKPNEGPEEMTKALDESCLAILNHCKLLA